jgi:hypothetical protein
MIRKTKEYQGEFAAYPGRAALETNFWTGDVVTQSQYQESTMLPSSTQKASLSANHQNE